MTIPESGKLFILLACICVPVAAAAETAGPFNITETKPLSEVWLNPGFYSYHFDTDRELNNNNLGLGAEYRYSTVCSVTAGRFHNSDRQISSYAAWYWQPLELGGVRLGILLGAIDGYPRANNGGWFPMALPVVSYEYKRIGISLTAVPTVQDTVYGSLTLQFKLRVY
jgi:hypothetical protein